MQSGRPVAALFKEPNGKTGPSIFAEGASARNGITVQLHPEFHAVFTGEYGMKINGRDLEKCNGKAYRWNRQTAAFEYDKRLGNRMGKDFCRGLANELRNRVIP